MAREPQRKPEEEQPGSFDHENGAEGSRAPAPQPRSGTYRELLGQTLGGRYRFDELLGEGTFARVYQVYDLHRRAYLAAKVLRSDIAQEPAFLERFRREAAVLSQLQHPHIVRYYDIVEEQNFVFILTDHIAGSTLQTLLYERGGEPLTPLESLTYLTPLASALHYAHTEGIVHRDLKPANILLDESDRLYVMDFGIARILSDASTLTMDMSVGTPHYMSPEQILAGTITPATDIYALGVMLYQMYTGILPFRGESVDAHGATTAVRIAYEHLHLPPEPPRQVNPQLSEAVQDVILRCLQKDPAQRYASVSELYDALTQAIGTPSVSLETAELGEAVQPRYRDEPPAAPSVILPEAEPAPSYWGEMKPKRKPKPQSQQPVVQGEKQREKDKENQEKEREKKTESEEKENEKGSEKTSEKSDFFGDIAPSDRLSQITWGGVVLWAGVVFLLNNTSATHSLFSEPWPWIFGGAGTMLLVEVGARLFIPEYRSKPGARFVLGVVLLMAGLITGFSLTSLWPLILIAIGVSLLINHLME